VRLHIKQIKQVLILHRQGAHIVSGAVIEPRALNELLPDWESREGHPLTQPATSSAMRFLTSSASFPIPHPPQMNNSGNYIVSLSRFTAWLGTVAEELGVEVYPGFGGAQVLYSKDKSSVQGVITNDVGLDHDFRMKDSFEPGMTFKAKVTLLAEGARGSLTKGVSKHFDLWHDVDPQTYGIGVKEVWRVDPSRYRPGEVVHTMGWPLDYKTYGGGWVYHMDGGLVSLGLVIGLDYQNPYLSPFKELQRMKHHPYFSDLLKDGERVAYGARVLNEGGIQSVPRLHFPGGALVGCSAGFVNIAKIKGTHNAMKSGMLAAESAFAAIENAETEGEDDKAADMAPYDEALRKSWIWDDLKEVRNLRPSFNTPLGIWGGMAYSGLDSLFLKGRTPWTFRNSKTSDALHTKPSRYAPISSFLPHSTCTYTHAPTILFLCPLIHAKRKQTHRLSASPIPPFNRYPHLCRAHRHKPYRRPACASSPSTWNSGARCAREGERRRVCRLVREGMSCGRV
jgi:electron-transferring-flavoprotein dehydrogenase